MAEVAPLQASSLLEHLRASTQPLTEFPRMGRMVPGLERDSLREIIVDQYRAIATLLHAAQDVEARLHEMRLDL